MIVLAKSDPQQSLEEHNRAVCDCAMALLTRARLAAFRRLGLAGDEARELLRLAVWLHDLGKATHEWQDSVRVGEPPQHALTSFMGGLWLLGASGVGSLAPGKLAALVAVLGHHGQLSGRSFDRERFAHQTISPISDAWEAIGEAIPVGAGERPALPSSFLTTRACEKVEQAKERCPDLEKDGLFRGLYCLLLSLLIESDHAASAGGLPQVGTLTRPHLPSQPISDVPTPFQHEVWGHCAQTLCAIAGCASGKTAAALLRGAHRADDGEIDRVVFCLPTRFTSNSLVRDMCRKYHYPSKQVGLVHGEAFQVLRAMDSEDERARGRSTAGPVDAEDLGCPGTPEDRASRSVRYEHPVTVSTVDHLLMSLYHGYRYSDRAFGNLLSSLVVFDEVHAYDDVTLNAIRQGAEVLARYGVPLMFMSATLSSSRRRFLGVGDEATVSEQGNTAQPFRITPLRDTLTAAQASRTSQGERGRAPRASAEVCDLLRQSEGLRLAVFVNQVERAKALAKAAVAALPGVPVICYHSELAPRDRIAAEAKIIDAFSAERRCPVVAIATQAAELSLDISADRMITELAPADVLVQRSGRLHRRGMTPVECGAGLLPAGFVYELFVAPLDLDDEGSALPYTDMDILRATWKQAPWGEDFTFARGMEWCENVLGKEPMSIDSGIWAASRNDAVFGNRPQENYGEDGDSRAVVIRDIDQDVVLAVPEIYTSMLPSTLFELSQWQVPVHRRKLYTLDAGLRHQSSRRLLVGAGTSRAREITVPITIISSAIPYDPDHGGFDFEAPFTGTSAQVDLNQFA